MNIFYLDSDPVKAAQIQYNKHVVKMILESAQMLCTAHHHYVVQNKKTMYLIKKHITTTRQLYGVDKTVNNIIGYIIIC